MNKYRVWMPDERPFRYTDSKPGMQEVKSIHLGTGSFIIGLKGSGNAAFYCDEYEITESTSLVDKSDKPIYIGDIIKTADGRIWEVQFDEEISGVVLVDWMNKTDRRSVSKTEFKESAEIVGDKYRGVA